MKINILFAKSFFERMVKSFGLIQKMGLQAWSITMYVALILFLFLNIVSSQSASFLYTNVINGKKQAVISFLKNIQLLPEFNQFLMSYKRKKTIIKIETALKKNPDARDVLYNLSILYKQNGNEKKSDELMQRAKIIDPTIN